MTTQTEEYETLREELIEHQNRRLSILSLALTISIGLFGAGLELNNPYLPLLLDVRSFLERKHRYGAWLLKMT